MTLDRRTPMKKTPMPRRKEYMERGAAERGHKAARIRRRRGMRTTTPRPGSRREAERRLKSLDAQIVKARDGYECVQCKADGLPTTDILDCGHLYPKGSSSFRAGAHLLENQFAQCRRHNTLHIRRPEYFMQWHRAAYGDEAHDRLHFIVTGPSPSTETLWEWVREREILLAQIRMNEMVAA